MNIIYTADSGWSLRDKLNADDFYVGQATASPFPYHEFTDLDAFIVPLEGGCKLWIGGSQYRTRPNCIPYYLNKYILDYPRQISARQLLVARHLNTHFLTMARFRIGMTCVTPACVEITHLIPYAYYPRTKKGQINKAATTIVAPELPELSEEEKNRIRKSVFRALESPESTDISSILPKSGRTADDFTPEELAKIEQARQSKTAEPESITLDDIGVSTKKPA